MTIAGTDGDCEEESEGGPPGVRCYSPSGEFYAQEWSGAPSRTAILTSHVGNTTTPAESDR